MLKVGIYIFGIDFLAATGASVWLMWLAAFSIIALFGGGVDQGQPEGAVGVFDHQPAVLHHAWHVRFGQLYGGAGRRFA